MTAPGAFDAAVREDRGAPHVKVCGITRIEDAVFAASLGVSAIGFVFWERSPRAMAPEAANAIASELPRGVLRVGVFVNALPHVVRQIAAAVPLDVVQLHGDEPIEWAGAFVQPVVKALQHRVSLLEDPWLATSPQEVTVLVDAVDPERRGGTGQRADWNAAAEVARRRNVVLAGGLTSDNVARAIRQVKPYAVDVSSGVERAPGVKDRDRLQAFMAAVREAGRSIS